MSSITDHARPQAFVDHILGSYLRLANSIVCQPIFTRTPFEQAYVRDGSVEGAVDSAYSIPDFHPTLPDQDILT